MKARYADFRTVTRSHSLPHLVQDKVEFGKVAYSLIEQIMPVTQGLRLLGLTLSGLVQDGDEDEMRGAHDQLRLFDVEK